MLRKKTLHSKRNHFKENRDEIHARRKSTVTCMKNPQTADELENGNPLEVDEISLRHCQWYDHRYGRIMLKLTPNAVF